MGNEVFSGRMAVACGYSLLFLAVLAPRSASAQTETPNAIRVETPEVVVPVVVLDRSHRTVTATTYEELDEEVTDLSVKDFHVFEDGVEQTIDTIVMESPRIRDVQDNVSHHIEYSFTPRGIWMSPDLSSSGGGGQRLSPLSTYLVTYTPPASSRGSCHQIRVRVRRRHVTVYARNEYCNVKHPLTDPIGETKLGKEMQRYADSGAKDEFPVFVQAGSYIANANRVEVAVEFPADAIRRKWAGVNLYATVAVLGAVRDKDGAVVTRFSDMTNTLPWNFYRGPLPPNRKFLKAWETAAIPSRYETQIELPPGGYRLQVVITDGEHFGWKEISLVVHDVHRAESLVSDILLCTRFHPVLEGAQAAAQAPKYVPLASDGAEFTPAGDTHFVRAQQLVGYFELRSTGATEGASYRLCVRDARSGEVKILTDWREVPAKELEYQHAISIAAEWQVDRLPPADYFLEVEVRFSAATRVGRSASFTLE